MNCKNSIRILFLTTFLLQVNGYSEKNVWRNTPQGNSAPRNTAPITKPNPQAPGPHSDTQNRSSTSSTQDGTPDMVAEPGNKKTSADGR